MKNAMLVGVELNTMKYDINYSLDELANLAKSLDINVVSRISQKLDNVNPKFYIGSGMMIFLMKVL